MELDTTISFTDSEDFIVFSVHKRVNDGANGIIGSHVSNNSSILDWTQGYTYYFSTAGTYRNMNSGWSTNLVVRAYYVDRTNQLFKSYENGSFVAQVDITTLGGGANFDRIFNRNGKDGTGTIDFGDLIVYRGTFSATDIQTVSDWTNDKYSIY